MRRAGRSRLGLTVLCLLSSAGCSRKAPPPPPPAAEPAPAPAPVPPREHVPLGRVGGARDGAGLALATLNGRTLAYVADEDDESIRTVDPTTREELGRTPLEGRPGQVLVGGDGRLFVALRDAAAVQVLESTAEAREPLDPTARIATAVEPIALAETPDGSTLLVASGWGHTLEGFAVAGGARVLAADLAREPRAVTVSSDGRAAFVAHAAAGHVSAVDLGQQAVAVIDVGMSSWVERRSRFGGLMIDFALSADAVGGDDEPPRHHVFRCGTGMMRTVQLPARVARQGYALARVSDDKGERVLAPHVAVATGDPKVLSTGYGGGGAEVDVPSEMFDIDVLDAAKRARTTGPASRVAVQNRVGRTACRLPRAAVVDPERKALLVACAGVDRVIEYDASSTTPTGAAKRSFVVPSGPTAIALDPAQKRAVVWSAFDRALSVLDLTEAPKAKAKEANAPTPTPPVATIALGATSRFAPEAAAGRKLFHKAADPRIARDGRACASCHPDGRDDGLVWSTPDGPRQTIFLAGRVRRTAPFGWLGKHGSLKEHITITMKNLAGSGLADEELDSIVRYLEAMKPPPATKAPLSPEAERGRALFLSSRLSCGTCHDERTGFTDMDVHEVGSATATDRTRLFLAPSLRFVAGSAPYFHDGRYTTLEDLLRHNDRMGDTKSLSDGERADLAAYLRTL